MKIAFLILNYNTASQTEKCIDAILKRNSEIDFKIGLLDNGSRDSSCAELVEKKYKTFVGGGAIALCGKQRKSWLCRRKQFYV